MSAVGMWTKWSVYHVTAKYEPQANPAAQQASGFSKVLLAANLPRAQVIVTKLTLNVNRASDFVVLCQPLSQEIVRSQKPSSIRSVSRDSNGTGLLKFTFASTNTLASRASSETWTLFVPDRQTCIEIVTWFKNGLGADWANTTTPKDWTDHLSTDPDPPVETDSATQLRNKTKGKGARQTQSLTIDTNRSRSLGPKAPRSPTSKRSQSAKPQKPATFVHQFGAKTRPGETLLDGMREWNSHSDLHVHDDAPVISHRERRLHEKPLSPTGTHLMDYTRVYRLFSGYDPAVIGIREIKAEILAQGGEIPHGLRTKGEYFQCLETLLAHADGSGQPKPMWLGPTRGGDGRDPLGRVKCLWRSNVPTPQRKAPYSREASRNTTRSRTRRQPALGSG